MSDDRHAPAALPLEKKGGSHLRRGWVGPKAGIVVLEITKSTPNSVRPARRLVATLTELPRLPYVIAPLRINQTRNIEERHKKTHRKRKLKAKVTISTPITARASLSADFLARAVPNFSVFKRVKTVDVKTAIDVKQWIHETAIVKCCL